MELYESLFDMLQKELRLLIFLCQALPQESLCLDFWKHTLFKFSDIYELLFLGKFCEINFPDFLEKFIQN